ncbi:hypothetical protein VTJ83DRAFT_7355 [Remersonia thermophila]|uniref:U3 small nucleolar RNA-associated protein 25 n=1 Tax=Remersonia thermophila TaxID=72144 RepID=A0ABR4D3F1_9PEZI
MAPGTRAGFRGRGGARGSRGRGRGRGKASIEPRSARFDDKRLVDQDESEDDAGSPSEEEPDLMEVDSEEESEEENKQAAQPYLSLMRSLIESNPHKTKRRKLDHAAEDKKEPSQPEPEPPASEHADDEAERDRDVDLVEEPEEDPADAPPEDLFDDDDDLDSSDPFEVHFADPKEDELKPKVAAIQEGKWHMERIATQKTRVFFSTPDTGAAEGKRALPASVSGPADLKLKKKLRETMESRHPKFDPVEQTIAPLLFNYHDLLYCNRTVARSQAIRRMACLHALNHIFKTRDRVIKNNAKLAKADGSEDLELRDQGFTRPKVLMLLPTRHACVRMMDMIVSLCQPDQQENRKRFEEGYLDKHSKFSDDKPEDFRDLFTGNDDDLFRLGVKFTRKTVKYFAQFYNSDMILASPLGLRMAIGSEEDKKLDFDFLSSIELVVVDQADALLMQNWDHVEFIFEHLNQQPREAHGCDFSRVRPWYLDDQAKLFRQTAIFTAFNTPELAELFRAHCRNWAGKARLQQEAPGAIQHLPVKARQTFSRFEAPSAAADPDARFAYFTKAIVPMLTRHRARDAAGTLVFIPSYLDFVRVRNYFANNPAVANVSFGTISEYADVPEASRARSHFLSGRHKVLLYTERAHHFRRYKMRGVKRVVMYALPDNPTFYNEIAGGFLQQSEQSLLLEPGQGVVRVMFSKYDVMKLERIVGTARVGRMIHDQGDTFDFV